MNIDYRIIFPILFVLDAVNALNAIRLDNRKYYAVTKPLLMPLLLASYLVFLPAELRNQPYQKYLLLAYFFHTAGDILLLFPKNKTKLFLYFGALSFFIGHWFNFVWFVQPCWEHSTPIIIVASLAVIVFEIFFIKLMLSKDKKQGAALIVYSFALAVLAVTIASTKSIAATFGIVFFWASDYTIARREQGLKTLSNEWTMITYLIGQVLLLTGMYLLQI